MYLTHIFGNSEIGEVYYDYDFHARRYAPALPIFDCPDPKSWDYPDTNPYLYCAANPVNFIDPLGTDTIRVNYVDDKWEFGEITISEGNDVFLVTKDNKTDTYVFSDGEYGNRVCALNLEIGENKSEGTFGIYHISGNKEEHGYYITPGGDPSTEKDSGQRVPEDSYPITTPGGWEQWRSPGLGGSVLGRGIRYHYGTGPGSTKGCFVVSKFYTTTKSGKPEFDINDSKAAYKSFCSALGDCEFYTYKVSNDKYRTGARYKSKITHTFHLQKNKIYGDNK